MCVGSLKGLSRKIVIIACYIPPNYHVGRGRGAIDYISDCVTQAKRKYNDPIIVIGGDFNQWQVEDATATFVDVSEALVGPTSCLLYTSPSPRD